MTVATMSPLLPLRTHSGNENIPNMGHRLSPIDLKAFSLARSAILEKTDRVRLNRSLDNLSSTRTTSDESKKPVPQRIDSVLRSTRVNSSLGVSSYSPPTNLRGTKHAIPPSIPAIFEQHSSRRINDDQLLRELSTPYGLKNHPIIFHPPFFKASIPLLEKLGKTNPGLVFDILSLTNGTGKCVLNHPQNFESALPFLSGYAQNNFNQVKALLMQCDPTVIQTLHDPLHFVVAWPILEMLAENHFEIFMKFMVDEHHRSALFCADNLNVALPYVIKLAQSHQTERLKSLICTQDENGNSLFHIVDTFLAAEPLLDILIETDLDLFVHCLSLPNNNQNIPLHHPTIQSSAAPYVRRLAKNNQVQLLISLLSIPTKAGRTLFHYNANFIAAIPLLYDLLVIDLELFASFLSFQDKDQKTPLHHHAILALAVSHLSEIIHTPKIIKRLLSMRDHQGMTPLHGKKNFKACQPFFQDIYQVDCILLKKLWTVKNAFHETPLHEPENFEAALPILENCATHLPKLVIKILSSQDKNGVRPLHVPANFALAGPLLKKLDARYPQKTQDLLK